MEGTRYIALATAVVLLAALPYAPWFDFSQTQHINPEDQKPDEHLPTQDHDRDELPDWWELEHDLNPFDASDALEDSDTYCKSANGTLMTAWDSLTACQNAGHTWMVGDGVDWNKDGQLDELERYTNLDEYNGGVDKTDPTNPDTDGDGIPDGWEVFYGLDPNYPDDAQSDDEEPDDELTNYEEYLAGTDPHLRDTDGDGMHDGWEIRYGLNPLDAIDALLDFDEYCASPTGRLVPTLKSQSACENAQNIWKEGDGFDYNHDGIIEFKEKFLNIHEYGNRTNPRVADTDGDGMLDGWEAHYGLNPENKNDFDSDMDSDTLTNLQEFDNTLVNITHPWMDDILTSDPSNPDTDGDGLLDGREAHNYQTDWTKFDTDEDTMDDGWEVFYELDPTDPTDAYGDPDGDGWDADGNGIVEGTENHTNLQEYKANSDPTDPDTDGDEMIDGWEAWYKLNATDPSDAHLDPDNDGWRGWDLSGPKAVFQRLPYTNLQEYRALTNPQHNDTDGDGMADGWEQFYGINPRDASDWANDTDWDGYDYDGSGSIDRLEETHPNLAEFLALSDPTLVDTDRDTLPDGWEHYFGLNATDPDDALEDLDDDTLSNLYEYNNSAIPSFYWETDNILTTDPLLNDTDMDGLEDGEEVYTYHTDPTNPDTDGDGMPDGWEILHGLNASNAIDAGHDSDQDGFDANWDGNLTGSELFTNIEEYLWGTDPGEVDSDGDMMWDGWEYYWLFNLPADPQFDNLTFNMTDASDGLEDFDEDGLLNRDEFNNSYVAGYTEKDDITGSNPYHNDTDRDWILDGEETIIGEDGAVTDPTNPDNDGDGLPDGWELFYGLDPYNASDADIDSDDDGYRGLEVNNPTPTLIHIPFTNREEYLAGTNPINNDTDGDLLPDGWELFYGLNASNDMGNDGTHGDPDRDSYDANGDGGLDANERWDNLKEYHNGTHPGQEDTDNDQMNDGWELYWGLNATSNEDAELDPDNDGFDADNSGDISAEEAFPNWMEFEAGSNPYSNDTDNDTLPDSWEYHYNLDPADSTGMHGAEGDPDNDGYDSDRNGQVDNDERFTNLDELLEGTDPRDPDTDDDGMDDGFEAYYD